MWTLKRSVGLLTRLKASVGQNHIFKVLFLKGSHGFLGGFSKEVRGTVHVKPETSQPGN